MRKIKKILLIFSIIITLSMAIMPIISSATISINSAELYSKGRAENLIKYKNSSIICTIVVYSKDGKEYPAYCLNSDLPGVGELSNMLVSTKELISNVKVWRAITNGYPYKSLEELGCATEEEAFSATKQAVYCVYCGRDVNDYVGIGEAGQRAVTALKKIVEIANNGNAVKVSSDLEISPDSNVWTIDNINNKYISKTFSVLAKATINGYNAEIVGDMPEGTFIADMNNNEKQTFEAGEKFKILIPLLNINKEGCFSVNVFGKVKTKPIIFGDSGNSSTQDYALTGDVYEDGTGNSKIYYGKNETKIIILKKTKETNMPLKGVQFQLLNENQEIIETELTTDENGKIVIDNLLPGKYYIKETKTVEGYSLYNKLIEVDVTYNEIVNITINNSEKEVKLEENIIETEIEVFNLESEQTVNVEAKEIKLPKTGM